MFTNRIDAGALLASELEHLRDDDVVVVGLPRGGVPVAYEVARALDAPLDVILVRKLGVPFRPELAMGAIGEDGVRVTNDEVIQVAGVSAADLARVEERERLELDRRARRYRAGRERVPLAGRVVVIVDDGIATGSTARAACEVAAIEGASRVILAVPVAPPDWTHRLAGAADELIAVDTPEPFYAIGQFYTDFSPTSDEDVITCLERAHAARPDGPPLPDRRAADPEPQDTEVQIDVGPAVLRGHLTVPAAATGTVVFAHGAGSSRRSPRNRYVASVLNDAGLATLLFDLLTEAEETDRANVFDIGLLGRRLVRVTEWVRSQPQLAELPAGYFGASTGAAAALWAAAEPGSEIRAVVSRGGRPDLATDRLALVRAPTLFVVGSRDPIVVDLNRQAQAEMSCRTEMDVIDGASHLFEEPGTLQQAAEAARDWFVAHLGDPGPRSRG